MEHRRGTALTSGPAVSQLLVTMELPDDEQAFLRDLVDLSGRDVQIVVDLHAGTETATLWTSDLTAEYVHENSAYST